MCLVLLWLVCRSGRPNPALVMGMVTSVCATCGLHPTTTTTLHQCQGCKAVSFCSPACFAGHVSSGICSMLRMERQWASAGRTYMPASFTTSCPPKPRMSAVYTTQAEYEQCVQDHPHMQRVAQVIMPAHQHADSSAVRAAQTMLVCGAGLLSEKDWKEVLRVCAC